MADKKETQEAASMAETIEPEQEAVPAAETAEREPETEAAETETEQKQKNDPRDVQLEELKDRLARQMAEFDNFRKRTEKEKSAMYEIGARDIIEKILPVLDNFERGLTAVPEDAKGSAFAEGIEMIYKQLVKMLEDAGVEAIEALGQQFDPDLHNAVLHVEDDSFAENEITQELQKGYKYRGTVIRHSMVQVAN